MVPKRVLLKVVQLSRAVLLNLVISHIMLEGLGVKGRVVSEDHSNLSVHSCFKAKITTHTQFIKMGKNRFTLFYRFVRWQTQTTQSGFLLSLS